jgi:hypothetical protein
VTDEPPINPRPSRLIARIGTLIYGEHWQSPLARMIGVAPWIVWRIEEVALLGDEHPDAPIHAERADEVIKLLYIRLLPVMRVLEGQVTGKRVRPMQRRRKQKGLNDARQTSVLSGPSPHEEP